MEIKELDTDCVFVEKELIPNTEPVKNLVELDSQGRIIINSYNQTSLPGVFAAGDITNIYAEQVLVAIGEGAKAALAAGQAGQETDYFGRGEMPPELEKAAAFTPE